MPIRVLLVDDQPLIRGGLVMLLDSQTDIEVVGEADDGDQAIEKAIALQPDVVVMDVRMPRLDGVEATRQLTSDSFSIDPDRTIKVLILTTYSHDETVHAALRAGASGFLLKEAVPAELARAVRAIASGDGWLDPAVTLRLFKEFAARPASLTPTPAQLDQITPRECEVLILVAYGLSNSEIAERLYISEGTVKTHYGRILMKLGLRDRAQAVVMAYQTGLVKPGTTLPTLPSTAPSSAAANQHSITSRKRTHPFLG